MSNKRNIREVIQQIAGTNLANTVYMTVAEVNAVNVPARTCTVITTGGKQSVTLEGVKLMASIDDGLLIVPAVGSSVIVSYSTYAEPFIVQFSAVDKVLFVVGDGNATIEMSNQELTIEFGNSKISLTAAGIKLNEGNNGGLTNVAGVTDRLNKIENDINNLKNVFASWVTVPNDGGAALKTAATTWTAQQLEATKQEQIEDKKVTH